jgi:CheY-like chemotaxis protein
LSTPRKLLVFGADETAYEQFVEMLPAGWSAQRVTSICEAASQPGEAVVVCSFPNPPANGAASHALQAQGLLNHVPEGLALMDERLRLLWCNPAFSRMIGCEPETVGRIIYDVLGPAEMVGPDLSPFHTAISTNRTSRSVLKLGANRYLQIQANAITESQTSGRLLLVSFRDITPETLQQQKLNAVYQAGLELGELSPQDMANLSVEDRVELLKARIVHYTKDLLQFETVEVRLLDPETRQLNPLLAVGMQPEACTRQLYASSTGNGVTGFVAESGKSYLCADTQHDPLYLPGAAGARSSLTVPLMLQHQVLGTFNVESSLPGAFSESDLEFLELFCREVAIALNTLDLLAAEKATTATLSTMRIMCEVARPADEVLNDAAWILEKYIGHDPNVAQRLQRILRHTRDIRQAIHRVGEDIAPKAAHAPVPGRPARPLLKDKRVLVADSEESTRQAAHELLLHHNCEVETAHNGEEALLMIRTAEVSEAPYDVVLVEIRLPDMTGYECFCRIQETDPRLPVILMTGFGYDAGHNIVKARQRGLKSVLYKPFRVEQLLNEVEKNLREPPTPPPSPTPPNSPQSGLGAVVTSAGDAAGSIVPPAADVGNRNNPPTATNGAASGGCVRPGSGA